MPAEAIRPTGLLRWVNYKHGRELQQQVELYAMGGGVTTTWRDIGSVEEWQYHEELRRVEALPR